MLRTLVKVATSSYVTNQGLLELLKVSVMPYTFQSYFEFAGLDIHQLLHKETQLSKDARLCSLETLHL